MILFLLATAGFSSHVSAQFYDPAYFQLSKTDQLFNVNNTQWLRHKFYFNLSKGNQVVLLLSNKNQLEKLMDLDSLMKDVYDKILLISDSLKNELTNKRIDIALAQDGKTRMRFQEFQSKGNSYAFQNGELVALKVEQDTINIIGYYRNYRAVRTGKQGIYFSEPYKVVLLLNNITELKDYLGKLNPFVQQVKTDWDNYKRWSPKKNWNMKLMATYGSTDPKYNMKFKSVSLSDKMFVVDPFVQISMQNVRNQFGPSVGLGIDLNRFNSYVHEKHFQLFWEPFFFFEKNSSNKTTLMRNDFISFQYKDIHELKPLREKQAIRYYQQFSLSYLFHRDGDYFEKNTFRMGLPGFQARNVTLSPEFIFHDLFKQFTPSLKLSLYLE